MSAPRIQPGPRVAQLADDAWLNPLPGHWIDAARARLSRHAALVRVTVVRLRGSAPREPGASMLVDQQGTLGSIGGGQLEWRATTAARELLRTFKAAPVRIDDLILGPDLGQCCGGRVELWLERLTCDDLPWLAQATRRMRERDALTLATVMTGNVVSHRLMRSLPGASNLDMRRTSREQTTLLEVLNPPRQPLWIFGAGHVGQALLRLLADLALFEITWIDSRVHLLPVNLPDFVTTQAHAAPGAMVSRARAGTHYVVLTHDHALDYELCHSILMRRDSSWLGLIGSASKAARFRARLLREGVERDALSRLNCPIGIPGIASKQPAAIAIAIAAELLQQHAAVRHAHAVACDGACGSCGAARATAK